MNKKIIESIKESITPLITSSEEEIPLFKRRGYDPVALTQENFHPIKKNNSNKKLCFIDGGNQELIKAPNFSLQLIRIYCTIYKDNKRIDSQKKEFYCLAKTKKKKKLYYQTEFFGNSNVKDFELDADSECLKYGRFKAKISKMADIARRFSELKLAKGCTDKLDENDIIILDGSLQQSYSSEDTYLEGLYKKAEQYGVIITALSKASSLLTQSGRSLINSLKNMSNMNEWYYYPVVNIENVEHKANMYFLKLHKNSKHIFRFELYKNNEYDIDKILTLLNQNSKDPVFLGYPYGLIEADRFARVSENEKEYYKTVLKNSLQKDLKKSENILNSHDILDNIS